VGPGVSSGANTVANTLLTTFACPGTGSSAGCAAAVILIGSTELGTDMVVMVSTDWGVAAAGATVGDAEAAKGCVLGDDSAADTFGVGGVVLTGCDFLLADPLRPGDAV
jgi:hypothetical protein